MVIFCAKRSDGKAKIAVTGAVAGAVRPSSSQFVTVRGLSYHVRSWGDPAAPLLFMLHGWMDVGASFQFLVDALTRDWRVLAPDWRGFGRSAWCADGYWFADYIADLDDLLEHFTPNAPARIAGHSLGGNVACIYAGVRPQRVARVVSLEGFGVPAEAPDLAPEKLEKWLDALRDPMDGGDHHEDDLPPPSPAQERRDSLRRRLRAPCELHTRGRRRPPAPQRPGTDRV
jgi:pimeloyl-ACP methyl ester carboxylesterase